MSTTFSMTHHNVHENCRQFICIIILFLHSREIDENNCTYMWVKLKIDFPNTFWSPVLLYFSTHMGKLCNKPINNLHICFHSTRSQVFVVIKLPMLRFYWVKVCDWKHNLIQIFPMDSVNVWGSVLSITVQALLMNTRSLLCMNDKVFKCLSC